MTIDALILAAGKGERMRSEFSKTPHEILEKPVVTRVLANVKKAKVE